MRTLHVWHGEIPVGSFIQADHGAISFEYDGSYPHAISQSLPLEGRHAIGAAANFLKNLLPENERALAELRIAKGIRGNDLFDLLDGMDTSGGLAYTLAPEPPQLTAGAIEVLAPEAIAAQIDALRSREVGDPAFPKRFSLAGAQSKFTMARVDGEWFSPSACIPSTHIVKMPSGGFTDCDAVEDATMRLAAACGLEVADHSMLDVLGRTAYITERFDRVGIGGWQCRRLHVEDFAQALGIDPMEKYTPTLENVVAMLVDADPEGELAYDFLRSYMFSAYAGGSDAHAKNFSLVYENDAIRLAPTYDAVLTSCWEGVEDGLALSMNNTVFYAKYLTDRTLDAFARHMGLDADRIVDTARAMALAVRDAMPEELATLPTDKRERALAAMERNTRYILNPVPGIERTWNPVYDDDWELPPRTTPSEHARPHGLRRSHGRKR